MAAIKAAQNGNWSSTATWTGGVLPSNGDTVYANGFTVTIDQNVTIGGANNSSVTAGSFVAGQRYIITSLGSTSWTTIGAASNTLGLIFTATGVGSGTGVASTQATLTTVASTGTFTASAGGGFTLLASYSVTADSFAGTTTAVTFSANSPSTATWVGNIYAGNAATTSALLVSGTGTLNITGNISGVVSLTGSGSNAGLTISSTGTVNITGSLFGGLTGGSNAISVTGAGTLTVSGGNLFGSSGVGTGGNAILINAAAVITVTGSLTAGVSNTPVVNVGAPAIVTIIGDCTSSNTANAVASLTTASTALRIRGSTFDASNGTTALSCFRYILNATPSQAVRRVALDGVSAFVNFYTADFSGFGQASVTDVRSGVSYAAGGLTGTAAIPSPASVAYGVPVDATTGTAVLTPSAVQAALLPLL